MTYTQREHESAITMSTKYFIAEPQAEINAAGPLANTAFTLTYRT